MAWHLVRLKLALLRGTRREASTVGSVGLALGWVFSIGLGGLAGALLLLARRLSPGGAGDLMAGVFLVLLLAWGLGPVLALAADNTLDIDRLALFPLRAGQLMPGLLLAAPVGFGGLCTGLILLGAVGGAAPAGPGALLTILAGASELALVVSISRLLSTALSAATRKRRWRDLALFVGPVLAIGINFGIQLANRSLFDHQGGHSTLSGVHIEGGLLGPLVAVLRWLPSGWAGQAMAAARRGDDIGALAGVAGTAALTGLLLLLWWRAIQVATTTSSVHGTAENRRAELIPRWAAWLPLSPAGAVAAKELRYCWRDPRQRGVMLGTAFAALAPLLSFGFVHAHSPRLDLLAVWPAVAIGSTGSNLFGFDGATWWTNVAAGSDMHSELVGRTAARLTAGAVAAVVLVIVLAGVSGTWSGIVPAFGLAMAGVGVSAGLGALVSIKTPVPIPPAGRSNVFGGGSAGKNAAAGGAALGVTFATAVIIAPLLVMVFLISPASPLQIPVAGLALAVGATGWRVGIGRAAARGEGHQADILAALSRATA